MPGPSKWHVQTAVATQGLGLYEGLDWWGHQTGTHKYGDLTNLLTCGSLSVCSDSPDR